MWLKCGAALQAVHSGPFVKARLNAAIAKNSAESFFGFFVVDMVRCRPYKPGHTARRPLIGVMARLKLLTYVWIRPPRSRRGSCFVGSAIGFGRLERGDRQVAGLFDR